MKHNWHNDKNDGNTMVRKTKGGVAVATNLDKLRPVDMLQDDPVWLFEQDLFDAGKGQNLSLLKQWCKWMAVVLVVVTTAFAAAYFVFLKTDARPSMEPFFLVELRVIDSGGHPITGADVVMQNQTTGVTDSFGEWRNFLRLKPGSVFKIKLVKAIGGQTLEEIRSVTVPLQVSKDHEPTIAVNITLRKPMNHGIAQKTMPVRERADAPSGDDQSSNETSSAKAAVKGVSSADDAEFSSVTLSVAGGNPQNLDATQIKQQMQLIDDIYPTLKRQFGDSGVAVVPSGDFRVTLSYVPTAHNNGVIQVNIGYHSVTKDEQASFIKEMGDQPSDIAARIVNIVKIHLPKKYYVYQENSNWYVASPAKALGMWRLGEGQILLDESQRTFVVVEDRESGGVERWRIMTTKDVPCNLTDKDGGCMLSLSTIREAPPITGWKPLRVKIAENLSDNAKIYASGYQAYKVGPHTWEYWGRPGDTQNMTIVESHRVTLQSKLKDAPGETVLVANKPPVPAKKVTIHRKIPVTPKRNWL